MSTPIVVEIEHRVATLPVAREERRNSLDQVAMRMLEEAFAECAAKAAGVLIVTGAGVRAFCAGDDVAKRILNDATALPPTAATLVNLLAERSNAFEGT